MLAVVNRELDADFDLDAFEHVARWNADEERIEMWLRSASAQRVRIAALDLTVDFAAGEEMLTEVSCKFRPDGVAARTRRRAGLRRIALVDRRRGDFGLSLVDESDRPRRAVAGRTTGRRRGGAPRQRRLLTADLRRIDAAAQHARHEAEVGGYVAAEAAAPALHAGRAAAGALTGLTADDVVFTTGRQPRARRTAERSGGRQADRLPAR